MRPTHRIAPVPPPDPSSQSLRAARAARFGKFASPCTLLLAVLCASAGGGQSSRDVLASDSIPRRFDLARAELAAPSRAETPPCALDSVPREGDFTELVFELAGHRPCAGVSVPVPNGERPELSLGCTLHELLAIEAGPDSGIGGKEAVPLAPAAPAARQAMAPPAPAPDAFAVGREFIGTLQKDSDTFPCTARVTESSPRSIDLAVSVGPFVTAWTFKRDKQRIRRCAGVQLIARGHRNFRSLRDIVLCDADLNGQTLRAKVRWTEEWAKRKPRYGVTLELRPK